MERVKGMPPRFVAIKRFSFTREDGKVFEFKPGEIYEGDFDFISKVHPECVGCMQEIEMTLEDWTELITERAFECKRRIAEFEQLYGEKVETFYYGIIPQEGSKVTGVGYAGGLPDIYHKLHYLEEDIERFREEHAHNLVTGKQL